MSTSTLGWRRGARDAVDVEVRRLGARPVVWVEFGDRRGGTPLSSAIADGVERAGGVARDEGMPLVVVLAATGADISEGIAALEGWGRLSRSFAACSGVVPTVIVVDGPAVSSPALLLGIADLVVMTEPSYAFVNGPAMVAEYTGVQITGSDLGGAGALARHAGVPSIVVSNRDAAIETAAVLLSYLPSSADEDPPLWPADDPPDRLCPEVAALIPATTTGSYDVRDVAEAIVDDGSLTEIRERFAPNMVTALATVGGRPIGIVANQPMALAGTLDIAASQKAARFVNLCDAFNIGILTLVDTPGFYPGKDLEWRGMIRHGAQLVFAYANATVPRLCVILRKSYGGAYIVMDSKPMGNDLCLAWPCAELAVMGAGQAAAILHRRATPEERAAFEADYTERLLNPYVAAERGYIDGVIDPAETRIAVAEGFANLESKREQLQPRKHGNEPL